MSSLLHVPQCLTCRKGLVAGQPSSVGAVTVNARRGWHLCGECKVKGQSILGGIANVTGKVLEERNPVLFQLAKDFYVGMRGSSSPPSSR